MSGFASPLKPSRTRASVSRPQTQDPRREGLDKEGGRAHLPGGRAGADPSGCRHRPVSAGPVADGPCQLLKLHFGGGSTRARLSRALTRPPAAAPRGTHGLEGGPVSLTSWAAARSPVDRSARPRDRTRML